MSYIQLPYGFVKNYEESQYIKILPYIRTKDETFDNEVLGVLKSREDLKKWLLATKDYGNDIQEDLNAIVGYDETFNNAIVRHTLDLKNRVILLNPNPLNVIFRDIKKFDQQNPIIDIIATQVKASKLTEDQLTKKA